MTAPHSRRLTASLLCLAIAILLPFSSCKRSDRRLLVGPQANGSSPAGGPVTGGALVTVTGKGFDEATPAVVFGGTPGSNVTVLNDATLTVRAPLTNTVGSVNLLVANQFGATTLAAAFTYDPVVLNPVVGPVTGGTVVSIPGEGFQSAGTISVSFGGVSAQTINVVSDTAIDVTVPANGLVGVVDVVVQNDFGQALLAGAFTYEAGVEGTLPTLASEDGGTTITVSTRGFTDDFTVSLPAVTFGGVAAANITAVDATTITADAPALAAGNVDVTVTDNGGSATLTGFTIVTALAVDDIAVNEFLANPLTLDANGDGNLSSTDDEYVEIVNLRATPADLTGFILRDGNTDRHTFPNPTTVPAGSAIVIFGGGTPTGFAAVHTTGHAQVASSGGLGLNNPASAASPETIEVVDATATTTIAQSEYDFNQTQAVSQNLNIDAFLGGANPTTNYVAHSQAETAAGLGDAQGDTSPGKKVNGQDFP